MKILKYEKKGNNNYQIYFDNDTKVKLNENIILKHKLLYKKEIDEFTLSELIQENNNYNIYDKCVKYISVRLRSTKEINDYMHRLGVEESLINETIHKLTKNKLLDDNAFAKAFTKDKFKFSSMGPKRIALELKNNHIEENIINSCIDSISKEEVNNKMDKQIKKIITSNKNKPNLRNKVYTNLVNLGYYESDILNKVNEYNL